MRWVLTVIVLGVLVLIAFEAGNLYGSGAGSPFAMLPAMLFLALSAHSMCRIHYYAGRTSVWKEVGAMLSGMVSP